MPRRRPAFNRWPRYGTGQGQVIRELERTCDRREADAPPNPAARDARRRGPLCHQVRGRRNAVVIEGGQHLVGGSSGNSQDDLGDADLSQVSELPRIRNNAKGNHVECLGVSADGIKRFTEERERGSDSRTADRNPSIAELGNGGEQLRACSSTEQRAHAGLLDGFRPRVAGWQVDELAMECRCRRLGIPERLHAQHVLSCEGPPLCERNAMIFSLRSVPAIADTQGEAATGKVIDGRHGLRQCDRVVLSHESDPGPQANPVGHGTGGCQGREGVEAALVVLEADAGDHRRRNSHAHREVRMLWEVEGVVSALFRGNSQCDRRHRLIREERSHTDVHDCSYSPCNSHGGRRRRDALARGVARTL